MSNSNSTGIEINDLDEITFVDKHWLKQHGHGSSTTIHRKRKLGNFPEPIENYGGISKWTIAQIKRHLLRMIDKAATQGKGRQRTIGRKNDSK